MSYDPQDAPDTWVTEVQRFVDTDGVWIVLVTDQDGNQFVVDEIDFDS
jgi:hypothetical protein